MLIKIVKFEKNLEMCIKFGIGKLFIFSILLSLIYTLLADITYPKKQILFL